MNAQTAFAPPRVIVLWCPDWPVVAARRAAGLPDHAPLALSAAGRIVACSAAARAESVRRGLRVREAQSRCPELVVLPYDSSLDAREFEPLVAAVEELVPGVQVLRPGLCAVRARGAARYYGGERAAGIALGDRLGELGGGSVRAGIADGVFTAEQAARNSSGAVEIVPAGGSAEFLSPFDVGILEEAGGDEAVAMVVLLRRLGIRTLGGLAALSADDVRTRFGSAGARLHALAAGRDSWPLVPRVPPEDIRAVIDFEPALELVEQVAFGVRGAAESFIAELAARRLVATGIRVRVESDAGESAERIWLHPRSFSPADVVDRVRWQAAAAELSSGIVRVCVEPDAIDAIAHHEAGLWGSGPDERVHHSLSRVQSLLGHDSVLVPVAAGGRTVGDRRVLVPWGDRPVAPRRPDQPWPGSLPDPPPSTVFASRHPLRVVGASGDEVAVGSRGALSSPPARMTAGARSLDITAWAGPWPIQERWWDAAATTRQWRFHVVDSTGCGWLIVLDDSGWWAEARYD